MPPDWRTAGLSTPRFGRGAIETREMAEALGRRALGSLAFSVILLSGDPARAGAARARPEVACPELKKS